MIKDYDESKEPRHVNPPLEIGRTYRFTAGKHTGRYFVRGGCSKEPHNTKSKLNHIIYLATPKYRGGWDLEEDVFGDFSGHEGKIVQYVEVNLEEVYNG